MGDNFDMQSFTSNEVQMLQHARSEYDAARDAVQHAVDWLPDDAASGTELALASAAYALETAVVRLRSVLIAREQLGIDTGDQHRTK